MSRVRRIRRRSPLIINLPRLGRLVRTAMMAVLSAWIVLILIRLALVAGGASW